MKKTPAKILRIFSKCNGRCAYCGCIIDINKFEIDHIKPQCIGGSNFDSNLNPSCKSCNASKHKLSIDEFRFRAWKKENGIPYFNKDQLDWFVKIGFDLYNVGSATPFSEYKFYFERM